MNKVIVKNVLLEEFYIYLIYAFKKEEIKEINTLIVTDKYEVKKLVEIYVKAFEKDMFKNKLSILDSDLSVFKDLENELMNLYFCEELIYNDIIKIIKTNIINSKNSLSSNDLLNKLPDKINDFNDIILYIGLANLMFEKMKFLLGKYDKNNGIFIPCNEIKNVYKLSK